MGSDTHLMIIAAMQQFVEGDRVRPRNGGPPMVVDTVLRSLVKCLVVDGDLQEKIYPAKELELLDKTPPEQVFAKERPRQ